MRVSTLVMAALSAVALAAPLEIQELNKRVYVTDVTVKYVTLTVTAGQPIPTAVLNKIGVAGGRPSKRPGKAPAPVVVPTPAPAPAPVPVVVPAPVEPEPAPAPEPVVVPAPVEPKPDPAPAPAPAPAPVENKTPVVTEPKPVTPAAPPAAGDYKAAVLYAHNVHRANHSAPAMVYSEKMAGYAATVAAKCVWGHDLTPGGGGYGQNIAMTGTSASTESAKDPSVLVTGVISNMWYNGELHLFPSGDYGKASPDMSNFGDWGHFSQVVWKGTGAVGCATQYCQTGTPMFPSRTSGWYTVCNYEAAGNMGGAYGANVFPPLGHATYMPVMPK